MCVYKLMEQKILEACRRLQLEGKLPLSVDLSKIIVEPSKNGGEIATNAALVLR